MPEEIKYIDNEIKPKLNEDTSINEIKEIVQTTKEEPPKEEKKISFPTWSIEPPVEIQRSIE